MDTETRTLTRHLGLLTTHRAYQILFLQNIFNIFTLLSIPKFWYDSYESVSRLLELTCLHLPEAHLSLTPTHSLLMACSPSPYTPHPFKTLRLHPGDARNLPCLANSSRNIPKPVQMSLFFSCLPSGLVVSIYCEHTVLHTSLHSDQARQHFSTPVA